MISLESSEEWPGARPSPADRGAVLSLRTAQGPWGIRIRRAATAVSSACPVGHEPKREPGSVVSAGTIRHGDTDFAPLDPESTGRVLRDSVVRWYAGRAEAGTTDEPGPSGAAGATPARAIEENRHERAARVDRAGGRRRPEVVRRVSFASSLRPSAVRPFVLSPVKEQAGDA